MAFNFFKATEEYVFGCISDQGRIDVLTFDKDFNNNSYSEITNAIVAESNCGTAHSFNIIYLVKEQKYQILTSVKCNNGYETHKYEMTNLNVTTLHSIDELENDDNNNKYYEEEEEIKEIEFEENKEVNLENNANGNQENLIENNANGNQEEVNGGNEPVNEKKSLTENEVLGVEAQNQEVMENPFEEDFVDNFDDFK